MAIAPIEPSVLRVDDDGITLLGGWSATSGFRHFPARRSVPSPVPTTSYRSTCPPPGRSGCTRPSTSRLAGYAGPTPYGLGIVELDGEPLLRIVTRLEAETLVRGTRVHLRGEELPGPDGDPVLTWMFRP